MTPIADTLLDWFRENRSNGMITPSRPISGSIIAGKFGLAGSPEVREIVHELRSEGHWIGASDKGYFYCLFPDEIAETIQSLQRRAQAIAIPANAMKAKIPLYKQESLNLA